MVKFHMCIPYGKKVFFSTKVKVKYGNIFHSSYGGISVSQTRIALKVTKSLLG